MGSPSQMLSSRSIQTSMVTLSVPSLVSYCNNTMPRKMAVLVAIIAIDSRQRVATSVSKVLARTSRANSVKSYRINSSHKLIFKSRRSHTLRRKEFMAASSSEQVPFAWNVPHICQEIHFSIIAKSLPLTSRRSARSMPILIRTKMTFNLTSKAKM